MKTLRKEGGSFARLGRRAVNFMKHHGEPFWFVLSRVLPLWLRTGRRPVLVSRYMAMGDVICTFPAAFALKKRHVGAALIFHCREDYACLPAMAGVTRHTVSELNVPQIRRHYRFCFSGIYEFLYGDERENDVSRENATAEFCRQHNLPLSSDHPPLRVAPQITAKVREVLGQAGVDLSRPFVAIHPGPTWRVREWPGGSWEKLLPALYQQGLDQVVQLGAGDPDLVGAALSTQVPHVISLVNRLTVEETVAVILLCDLFVGVDSGLLHVAASAAKPAVGLFGPTSPQFRYPPEFAAAQVVSTVDCQGCHHRMPRLHWADNCPHGISCMKAISVEFVVETCLARWKPAPAFTVRS